MSECDTRVSTNSCDVVWNWGACLIFFCQTKLFVPNTRYNAFVFVMSGFRYGTWEWHWKRYADYIKRYIDISNRKNPYARFIENMWQSASIYVIHVKKVRGERKKTSSLNFLFNNIFSYFCWIYEDNYLCIYVCMYVCMQLFHHHKKEFKSSHQRCSVKKRYS